MCDICGEWICGKRLKRIGPEKKYQHKCFYREDAEKEELELYRRGEL